jgi:hypothetical protein
LDQGAAAARLAAFVEETLEGAVKSDAFVALLELLQ